ncbi:MAG: adenylosuccinate lyase family protein [Litoreibacter sp.]|nr:adenylosuccinate lyase family protein [Litoreibacter sp.]
MGKLFTDSAEVRAMMLVEGALAKAQGKLGVIPELSANFIHRAAMEVQIDPAGLSEQTGQNAVPVPALLAAFRKAMEAPEHAQYLHFGATSQDIMDTGLVLRLRQVLAILETRITVLLGTLTDLAEAHAETPISARTYGQVATPTSFGAVLAEWGDPLLRQLGHLEAVRSEVLQVSLSGAAGTLSAMGPDGPEVRKALAQELGLGDPEASWHSTRDQIGRLAAWLSQLTVSLGKMGEDLLLMTLSVQGEVTLSEGGGSSTMPQKQNPVQPSALVALARMAVGLNSVLQGAGLHRQQRDGAAWMTEWMSLPQLCMAAGQASRIAAQMTAGLTPDIAAMCANIDDGRGLIYAEALSFELARTMPRLAAQDAVKALCQEVLANGGSLAEKALAAWPDKDLGVIFNPEAQLGQAPTQARRFAAAARAATRAS